MHRARKRYRAHRNPHSTYRDDAYAPLHEAGWREEDSDFGKREAVYFCLAIWTTQIALNRLVKLVFFAQQVLSGFDARPCGRRLLICPTGKSVSAVS
jgi:hypothetical protein